MERVSITPTGVRGLGNIVSPKTVNDFSSFYGSLVSGVDIVNGEEMTVYSSSYLPGSSMVLSCPSVVSPDVDSFTVSGTLVDSSDVGISSATVNVDVNGEVTTVTTNSSGAFTFTVNITEDVNYLLHVYYLGTDSIAGCGANAHVIIATPESLELYGSTDLLGAGDVCNLVGIYDGVNGDGEPIGIPYATVNFFEDIAYYRILDKAVVSCESSGTNYCYSIGLDDLDWDLSQTNWIIEFDFINTVNGGRLCIGDRDSWSSGSGAGDNYLYCGTSTAGNGGYGTKISGTTDNSSTGAVTAGDTLHYKIVRNGDNIDYYLNGTLRGSKTATFINNIHEWSIYLQLWNNGDTTIKKVSLDLAPEIRVSPHIIQSGDTEDLTVTLVDPVDGSRIRGETINVYVESGANELSLTSNKTVLSAYDSESCTLSATLVDGDSSPVSGETVSFKKNGVLVDTVQTNSSGVATYAYSAVGSGDVVFTVEAAGASDSCTIEDCIIAGVSEQTFTSSGTVVSSALYSDIFDVAGTNFELVYDIKTDGSSGGLNIGATAEYTPPSSANYRIFLGGDGGNASFNNRTTSSSNSTKSMSRGTYHTLRLTKEGTSVKGYVDDALIATKTVTWLGNYSSYDIYWINWGSTNYMKNLKIKPL